MKACTLAVLHVIALEVLHDNPCNAGKRMLVDFQLVGVMVMEPDTLELYLPVDVELHLLVDVHAWENRGRVQPTRVAGKPRDRERQQKNYVCKWLL